MRNNIFFILVLFFLLGCEYLPKVKKDEIHEGNVIARVYDSFLYDTDIGDVIYSDLSATDSIVFVKSYINSWARKQLLLRQAEINLVDNSEMFDKQVADYHTALYINSYKESLVLAKLNTAVTEGQIAEYYAANRDNFKLNEELIQLRFIHTDSGRSDKKDLIKSFKSTSQEDINSLQLRALEFKSFNFNDSIWVKYTEVIQKIKGLEKWHKTKALKKINFIEKEDSLGLYLVTVKDILKRNQIAPLSYVSPTIKQVILQKRKLELLREIEVDLLKDAVKNQYFEEY
jgi:hypothetical protein